MGLPSIFRKAIALPHPCDALIEPVAVLAWSVAAGIGTLVPRQETGEGFVDKGEVMLFDEWRQTQHAAPEGGCAMVSCGLRYRGNGLLRVGETREHGSQIDPARNPCVGQVSHHLETLR